MRNQRNIVLRLSTTQIIVIIIFLIALSIRLHFAVITGSIHNNYFDMATYNELALKGGISYSPPPGYPLFLRAVYAVFGRQNYTAVYIVQALISSLTIILIYVVTSRVHSTKAGLIAAGIAAFYPNFIVYNLITLTETISILFIILIVYMLVANINERNKSLLAAAVMCFGYFFKPALLYCWPGVLLCLKKKLPFVIVTVAVMVSWNMYGKLSGSGTSRIARIFYKTYNPEYRDSRALTYDETPLGRDDLPSSEYLKSALEFIKNNKWETLDIIYKKVAVLFSWGHSNYTVRKLVMHNRDLNKIMIYCYIPIMILGFIGLVRFYDERNRVLALPMFSYLLFIILTSVFKGRYRLIIEPIVIMYASIYISSLVDRLNPRRNNKM